MKLFSENIFINFHIAFPSHNCYNIIIKMKERFNIMMKYTIYYSCPNDIQRYVMNAKDEKQLVTFLKMLTDENDYNFHVKYTIIDL